MKKDSQDQALFEHLTSHWGISQHHARNLVVEVLNYFNETIDSYVRRRHQELQASGLSNASIYQQLMTEVDQRRFRSTALSERQIRRIIYG